METFWQDLIYSMRQLARSLGFAAAAVLTLALGIGANTAVFSLTDQVLLRLLPVENPEELVVLRSPGLKRGRLWSDIDDGGQSFSYPAYHVRARTQPGVAAVNEYETQPAFGKALPPFEDRPERYGNGSGLR